MADVVDLAAYRAKNEDPRETALRSIKALRAEIAETPPISAENRARWERERRERDNLEIAQAAFDELADRRP